VLVGENRQEVARPLALVLPGGQVGGVHWKGGHPLVTDLGERRYRIFLKCFYDLVFKTQYYHDLVAFLKHSITMIFTSVL
jgi:hypothetical protein